MRQTLPIARRYSGAIVSHPYFDAGKTGLGSLWRDVTKDQVGRGGTIGDWEVFHAIRVSQRNFYAESLAAPDELSVEGGFKHDILIGRSASSRESGVLIATPYVHFLADILKSLEKGIGQPRPSYRALRMAEAFQRMADPPATWVKTRMFSVKSRLSPGADLLSVAGRNPLRSDLGRQFAMTAGDAAYGIRLQASNHPLIKTNVNFDRHGNLWWYHRGPVSLSNVLPVLDLLMDMDLMQSLRQTPPARRSDDD